MYYFDAHSYHAYNIQQLYVQSVATILLIALAIIYSYYYS